MSGRAHQELAQPLVRAEAGAMAVDRASHVFRDLHLVPKGSYFCHRLAGSARPPSRHRHARLAESISLALVPPQGYLFRFINEKVTASAKARGVVDLSKVQDVKVVPGKGNTIQLKTASGGVVQYMAATETEVVEWVSALEGAVQRICKEVAGVEDEPPKPKPAPAKSATAPSTHELIKQLERNFESVSTSPKGSGGGRHGGGGSSSHGAVGQTMVSVLGYDAVGRDAPSGSSGRGAGRDHYDSHAAPSASPYSTLNRQYSSGYTTIAGTVGLRAPGKHIPIPQPGMHAARPAQAQAC